MQQIIPNEGFLARLETRLIEITKLFHYIGQISIFTMMLLTVASSLGRYFFKAPISGSVELTCLLMVVMAFMLSGYTLSIKSHINISIFTDMMSKRWKAGFTSFANSIIVVLAGLGFFQSIQQGIFIRSTGTYTPVLHIPYSPFYYIVSIGWLLIAMVAFVQLLMSIIQVVKK